MRTVLPTIEGLYATYSSLGQDAKYQRPSYFSVIGPTRGELKKFAPTVLGFLDDGSSEGASLHLPVDAADSLRRVAEIHADWVCDYQSLWAHCIVLPEEVLADWPTGQTVFDPAMIHRLHPAIVLAGLVSMNDPGPGILIGMCDSGLLDNEGRRQRSLLAREIFLAQQQDDLLQGNQRGFRRQAARNNSAAKLSAGSAQEASAELHKTWTSPGHGLSLALCPRFVWAHQVEGANEFVSVLSASSRDHSGWSGREPGIPRATHLRRLSAAMVHDLHADPSAIENLARVATGLGDRTDDDRFVPIWELGPSGMWGAGAAIDADLAGFRGIKASRGYELKPLSSIACIEKADKWSPVETSSNTLWFVAEGKNVLRCLSSATICPDRRDSEPQEGYDARQKEWLEEWSGSRLLSLSNCDDAEYLWLALADEILLENIRCRAAKSYWGPAVPPAVLAETLVPWPTNEERKRIVDLYRKSRDFVEGDIAGSLIQELHDRWDSNQHFFAAGNAFSRVIPRDLSDPEKYWPWAGMVEDARSLLAALERMLPTRRSFSVPAPIAIARKKLEIETNPGRRIRAALDLFRATLEFDAAIMLAILHKVGAISVEEAWRKVSEDGARQDLQMAEGHKRMLAQEARRALKQVPMQGIDPSLATLAADARGIDDKSWLELSEKIVRIRNEAYGHGRQVPASIEQVFAREFVNDVEAFVKQVPYLNQYQLIFLESREIRRDRTICQIRELVGDNGLFAPNQIERARGSQYDHFAEGEVYLGYSEPDGLLPLWPWVLFQPDKAGPEVIWLFDGTKGNDAVFKSVQSPGEMKKDSEAGTEISRRVGRIA